VTRSRRSKAFTNFDGNLAAVATNARLASVLFGPAGVAPTALEVWAACPFRFFLAHVLRVRVTDRPDDIWTIDPLERGRVVHDILEDYYRRGTNSPTDLARVATAAFAKAEAAGEVGHPVDWEVRSEEILEDIEFAVVVDAAERQTRGLAPWLLEQSFGRHGGAAWPAVQIPVDGGVLRLGGRIDRVDRTPDHRVVRVYDYKTGRSDGYVTIDKDPLLRGRHIQLAIYARAVRAATTADEVTARYWFPTRAGGFATHELRSDAQVVDAALDDMLARVARGVRGGVFPQDPGKRVESWFDNCRYCDYERICPSARGELARRKAGDSAITSARAGFSDVLEPDSETDS
jgi:RecB family exonuclease